MGLTSASENTNAKMAVTYVGKNKHKIIYSDEHSEDFYEALAEHQGERSRISKKYVAYTIFASLNQLLLGYNVGVMSGAIIFIQEDLKITDVQQEILVGIFGFVSLLGSVVGGKTSDLIGRKWTLALAALLLQLGSATMAVAPSFSILIVGRLFSGVGMGLAVMIAPMYIAEISPADARGFLTSFPEVFVNVGIMLGYVSNYAFSGLSVHINWKIMLGVGILPSVFIWFALFIIPESPRWLVMQNRVEEARSVLLKTGENEAEVEERLMAIFCVCGYVGFFSLGLGPLCSVVTSEVFPLRLRAQASALAAVVNRLCSAFVAMSFLSLAQKVTVSGTFFIYAALSVLSVLFVHTLVPETKGKSLEQVELLFQGQPDCQGSKMEKEDSEHLVRNAKVIGA